MGLDLAVVTEQADTAFEEYERAQRAAIRAQADTRVKIAGGFSRAITLKEKEILDVENVNEALIELGLTANIKQGHPDIGKGVSKETWTPTGRNNGNYRPPHIG